MYDSSDHTRSLPLTARCALPGFLPNSLTTAKLERTLTLLHDQAINEAFSALVSMSCIAFGIV